MVTQASQSLSTVNGNVRVHCPDGVLDSSKLAGIAASFRHQDADETVVRDVSAVVLPLVCSVTASGDYRTPGGNSLFCFGFAAHGVTVSLEILFGKYTEKICRDPP
jgi:hypothetical protein